MKSRLRSWTHDEHNCQWKKRVLYWSTLKANDTTLSTTYRINHQIRSPELRVITDDGANLGVLSFRDALEKAMELGLDLIEISPNAAPPIAKIMDYGKFQYLENKKNKETRGKLKTAETKNLQVKIGTSEHDLELKARRASEWLGEGHRIKIDLFLIGRSKYMDFNFLKERMERLLKLLSVEYKIADPAKKSPKGVTITIEKLPAKASK